MSETAKHFLRLYEVSLDRFGRDLPAASPHAGRFLVPLTDGRNHRVSGSSTPSIRNIVDDFRQIVDPRVAAAQVPRMHAALQQGRTVDFGDFTVEPGGLYRPSGFLRKEKRLAWAEVKGV